MFPICSLTKQTILNLQLITNSCMPLPHMKRKSNCTTIMASLLTDQEDCFNNIEKDPNSKYQKIILDYTVGLDKIYDRKEIEKKKNEPEFLREYAGHYLGKVGNVFLPSQIQKCIN